MQEIKLDILSSEGNYTICAILTLPDQPGKIPIVLMCHGTAGNKNEVGDGYRIMAQKLAQAQIASLRFDFIGCGDSKVDYQKYNFTTALRDMDDVLDAVLAHFDQPDRNRIGLIGWSQGGTIALLSAGKTNRYKSLCMWSAAVSLHGMFDEAEVELAKKQGYVKKEWTFRSATNFSLQWYLDVLNTDVLKEFSSCTAPVLALAGEKDELVDPLDSKRIVGVSSEARSHFMLIENADHIFNILKQDGTFDKVVSLTADWFLKTL